MEGRFLRSIFVCVFTVYIVGTVLPSEANEGSDVEKEEKDLSRIAHQINISSEMAFDTNARRKEVGPAASSDFLTYILGSGRIESRRARSLLVGELDLGGKYFFNISAEDALVGRMAFRWLGSPRPRIGLGTDFFYKDRFQRGDSWSEVEEDPHLACRAPSEEEKEGYRCNRRDYRQGAMVANLDYRLWESVIQWKGGASFTDYKPNRHFSYLGPDTSLAFARRLGENHLIRLQAGISIRFYHPDSVTYLVERRQEEEGGVFISELPDPRIEKLFSGALGWRYRGPLILSGSLNLLNSRNNSDGMDAIKARGEIGVALEISESTILVGSGALQIAHYPQGNIFKMMALLDDEDERQNSISIQLSQRLFRDLFLIFKAQAFANEFSAEDSLAFRRQVFHVGLRWSS